VTGLGRTPLAWVLNLDAEQELQTAGPYAPRKSMLGVIAAHQRSLLGRLVREGDVILTSDSRPNSDHALPALAWCPTPWARSICERAGCSLQGSVALEVLRDVNHKGFAAQVRSELKGAFFAKRACNNEQELLECLARPEPHGWLARRPFGAAGRGRMRFPRAEPTEHEWRWIRASFELGPLWVEPWVEVEWEVSSCGWIAASGEIHLAPARPQAYDGHGAWAPDRLAHDPWITTDQRAALAAGARHAAHALVARGYRGPFGIDAFGYRSASGELLVNPLSEINARFTMAWPDSFEDWLTMGLLGPDGRLPW